MNVIFFHHPPSLQFCCFTVLICRWWWYLQPLETLVDIFWFSLWVRINAKCLFLYIAKKPKKTYAETIQSSFIKESDWKSPCVSWKAVMKLWSSRTSTPKKLYIIHCIVEYAWLLQRAYTRPAFDASATLPSVLSNSCPSALLFIEPINDLLNNKLWVMGP